MKIKISERKGKHHSELSQMRHKGDIPAILYAKGVESKLIAIDGEDFRIALRTMKQGHLPTTVFEFELGGKKCKAVVKDIQYHRTTYPKGIQHVDLLLLQDNVPVKVSIPVRCRGVADCAGIKLGGFLRQVIRHVKVKCLPKDLPSHFDLNIKEMAIGNSKRISDIDMPESVISLAGKQAVVVTIAKR